MAAKQTYAVGNGKPPRHTQFKKGQSGNPSGLPGPAKSLDRRLKQAVEKALEGSYWDLANGAGAFCDPPTTIEMIGRAIALSAARGDHRKIALLQSLLGSDDAAEPYSLVQGKTQGKIENSPPPAEKSESFPGSGRQAEAQAGKPAGKDAAGDTSAAPSVLPEPAPPPVEKPAIYIGGRRVQ